LINNEKLKNDISNVGYRHFIGKIFLSLFIISTLIGIIGLIILLIRVGIEGIPWLSTDLINNYPSRKPDEAGLKAALFGSIWLMGLTGLFSIPIGIGAAIYLEEYAPKNKLTSLIEINISNLAGVPSIIYGLLGLSVFVYAIALGRSVLAGSLTMSLLILPIVILASRESIRAVPGTYRDAAYALGASQWDVVRKVVLPAATPGILTGIILGMSRAVGETAPVIAISALVYLRFVPDGPLSRFTVLPIQIYNWVARPQEDFRGLAAAGIIVLLTLLLSMNSIAIFLRNKYQRESEE
jgi:phosphate transport system permease protein|tara:strand:- start:56937 stop:57824 length:888 start_codon:yes stop_codon:yes gene_type:complete